MAHVGLFDGIWRDLTGRGMFGGRFQIRLIAQPLIALVLGARFGIRDAKEGKEPFFMTWSTPSTTAGPISSKDCAMRSSRFAWPSSWTESCSDSSSVTFDCWAPWWSVRCWSFFPSSSGAAVANRIWTHGHHTRQIPHTP